MLVNYENGTSCIEQYPTQQEMFEDRVSNPAFDQLASLYRYDLPASVEAGRLRVLKDIAAEHWDFRKGAERSDVKWSESTLAEPDSPLGQHVLDIARDFGMVDSSFAKREHYDFMILPGGADLKSWWRARFGQEQTCSSTFVIGLGSDRQLSDAERMKVAGFAPVARSEYDLMLSALNTTYAASGFRDYTLKKVGYDHGSTPLVCAFETTGPEKVFALNAPIPEGSRRANTSNTFELLRAFAGRHLGPGVNVLQVTNARYSAFQNVNAQRLLALPSGASVETIGFSTDYEQAEITPAHLLQETKAYIDALDTWWQELSKY